MYGNPRRYIRDLAPKRFRSILSRLSFRDWTFKVGEDGSRCYLQVEFLAADSTCSRCGGTGEIRFMNMHPEDYEPPRPCSDCGGVKPQRGRKWFLSDHMTDSEVVQTALAAVLAAVEHEATGSLDVRR